MPNPEGGDNSQDTLVGELKDQPSPRPVDTPTITELEAGEPEKQPEEVTEEPPQQPEAGAEQVSDKAETVAAPELPEKFRGKTLEDVIEMYKNVEKFAGELAEKKGQLEQYVRQAQAASQVQTVPPATQVQPTVDPVGQNDFAKAMDKYVEGDSKMLESLLANQVNYKVQEELRRVSQAAQYQNEAAYRNALGTLESKADLEYRKLSMERGATYEDVEKRIAEEFNKDQNLKNRVFGNPLGISDQEIALEVRRLYDQSYANEESRVLNILKKRGVNLDTAKQLVEAQKEIASKAVHVGTANKTVGSTEGRPAEHEEELQRLGL